MLLDILLIHWNEWIPPNRFFLFSPLHFTPTLATSSWNCSVRIVPRIVKISWHFAPAITTTGVSSIGTSKDSSCKQETPAGPARVANRFGVASTRMNSKKTWNTTNGEWFRWPTTVPTPMPASSSSRMRRSPLWIWSTRYLESEYDVSEPMTNNDSRRIITFYYFRVIDGFEALDELEKLTVNPKTYRPVVEKKINSVTIHANPLAGWRFLISFFLYSKLNRKVPYQVLAEIYF